MQTTITRVFVAPRKYWDLYDPGEIELPENYRSPPRDAPEEALHGWGELRAYTGIPRTGPLTDDQARTLIHGYYACVSHVDAQVGLLENKNVAAKSGNRALVERLGHRLRAAREGSRP